MVLPAGAGVIATGWSNLTTLIDPGLSVNQTLHAQRSKTENVFHSDLRFFAAAAMLEVVAALSLLPLFWRWWKLGKMSFLSPIELALAFDSPLLKSASSATGSSGAIKSLGNVKVKYGAVYDRSQVCACCTAKLTDDKDCRLGIGHEATVMDPPKDMRFAV